jgi:hypothetical protein
VFFFSNLNLKFLTVARECSRAAAVYKPSRRRHEALLCHRAKKYVNGVLACNSLLPLRARESGSGARGKGGGREERGPHTVSGTKDGAMGVKVQYRTVQYPGPARVQYSIYSITVIP